MQGDNKRVIKLIQDYIQAPYKIQILEVKQRHYYFHNGKYNNDYATKIGDIKKYMELVESIVNNNLLTKDKLEEFRESRSSRKLPIKEEFKKVLEKLEEIQ